MKLKKSFSVNLFISILLIIFSSCTTTSSDILVPGEGKAKNNKIYEEYLNIADTYYSLEKYDDAISYYKKAMNNKNLYWGAYYKLAKCYVVINNWTEALPMYNTLLNRDPDNNSIKASVAYIYCMQGNLEKAEEIYSYLIETQTENQQYLENYIAVLISDKNNYSNNKELIEKYFLQLKENYPDSKNIQLLQKGYDSLLEKNEK